MKRIAVVGTGYVGLTTGAYLAHLGHDVVCADVIPEKVERLQRGEIPIVEADPGKIIAQQPRRQTAICSSPRCSRVNTAVHMRTPVGTRHRQRES